MADDQERRIDELYAVPLDRFMDERARHVKELKAAGDGKGAKRVQALKKPVVAAWALNVLSRNESKVIEELGSAGQRLRDAQRRALSGGDAEPLREATQERHAIVGRLTEAALGVLKDAGVTGATHGEDITSTLDAAAIDPDAFETLRQGRLVKPLRPPTGFGEAAFLKVVPGAKASARAEEPERASEAQRQSEVRTLRRELSRAESESQKATRAVDHARSRLEELEQRRAEAKKQLREAEARARGASLEVKRLQRDLSKLDPS